MEIYQSSLNDEVVKVVGPHKELISGKLPIFDNFTMSVGELIEINNIIDFGKELSPIDQIIIGEELISDDKQ